MDQSLFTFLQRFSQGSRPVPPPSGILLATSPPFRHAAAPQLTQHGIWSLCVATWTDPTLPQAGVE